MTRIQQLPPLVVTKIAAGEVIERPASVVKELLENAIDAGSRRIDVEVEQGGIERIRVVDDGCGIDAQDLPLAFASHATSKLANAEDLFRIQTLGFRGEALASIGGVAQVTLQSRTPDAATGAEIHCNGGEISTPRAWNGAPGTRLDVRHLFFNTPVRRKFLRTPVTEMGHVCEVFTRQALAHPGVHLTLRHNSKEVYEVPAGASLLDRLGLFFGKDVRDKLLEVRSPTGPVQLHGYLADPACDRGTAKLQYVFLNGRWIRDRSLSHAIQEAYRGLLMTGRYAVVFLFITMPPDQVDVNVHPTKVEVRFRDSQAIHHLVFSTLRDRLRAENLTARLHVPPVAPTFALDGVPLGAPQPSPGLPPVTFLREPVSEPPLFSPAPAVRPVVGTIEEAAEEDSPVPLPPTASPVASVQNEAPLKVIQLYDSYLVVETKEGMLVIDQHALHERILFEQFKERLRAGRLETQRLLLPEPVELTAEQAARVLEHREALRELGLEVEEFGGTTILLTGYPAILGQRPPLPILQAVIDHLQTKDRVPSREALYNHLLSLMACHAAVRAGDRLSANEIASLIAQRGLAHDVHHCPHGRPTALLFSREELERQFRRV